MKREDLRRMIREEASRLGEDKTKELMSGGMKRWWEYDKADVMSFVYWTRGQLPPRNEADFEKNWKVVAKHLNQKFPAPPDAYRQAMGEARLTERPADPRMQAIAVKLVKSDPFIENAIIKSHVDADKLRAYIVAAFPGKLKQPGMVDWAAIIDSY